MSKGVLSADIFYDESVLAFTLGWKSGKFQKHKVSNTLVTSYCKVRVQFLPLTQYGCGVLFICAWAYQSLHSDKLINSTLSVLIIIRSAVLGGDADKPLKSSL